MTNAQAKRGRRPRNLVLRKDGDPSVNGRAFCTGDRVLLENRPSICLFERN